MAIEALNNGADFYLQKGGEPAVQFGELKNAIIQLTQRKRAEMQVVQSERKYRDLVESANSIVLKLDTKGIITFLNSYGMGFFACCEDVVGKPVIGTLIGPESYTEKELKELISAFSLGGDYPLIYSFPIRRRDGKEAWVSWTTKALRDENGEPQELLVIGSDVTAAKKAELDSPAFHFHSEGNIGLERRGHPCCQDGQDHLRS